MQVRWHPAVLGRHAVDELRQPTAPVALWFRHGTEA